MAVQREPIFEALFNLIAGISDFKLTSRVLLSWDDIGSAQLPAAFLTKGSETSAVVNGMPPIWTLRAWAVFYVSNDQGRLAAPSTQLNLIATALETALERKPIDGPITGIPQFLANPPGSWGTTLGGLCYSCQIVGECLYYEGNIAGRAEAGIPIEILATG